MYYGTSYRPTFLLSQENALILTAGATLSITGAYTTVQLNAPSNYTVTFPAASTVPFSAQVVVSHCGSSGVCTLSGSFFFQGSTVSSLPVYPNDSFILEASGGSGHWVVIKSTQVYTQASGTANTSPASTQFVVNEVNAHSNGLINGTLQVWQRGTSGFGGLTISPGAYTADRTLCFIDAGGAGSVSRTTIVTGTTEEPYYGLSFVVASASTSTNPYVAFPLEFVKSYAGQNVVLSFYASTSSGTVTLSTPTVSQNFGTGGTPSSTVTTNGSAYNIAAITTTRQRFYTTFAVPSLSGKLLGMNGDDYVRFHIKLPQGSAYTVIFDSFKLEYGTAPTPVERPRLATILHECRRYFEVIPFAGNYWCSGFPTFTNVSSGGTPSSAELGPITFVVPKRVTPTLINSGYSSSAQVRFDLTYDWPPVTLPAPTLTALNNNFFKLVYAFTSTINTVQFAAAMICYTSTGHSVFADAEIY